MSKPLTASPGRARPAFTLIEVLIVVAIIALLASITLGVSRAAIRRVYENRTLIVMKAVSVKIKVYKSDRDAFPPMSSGGGTSDLVDALNHLENTDVESIVGKPMFNKTTNQILDAWRTPIRYYTDNSGPPNVDERRLQMNYAPILISAGVDTQFGTLDDVMVP